MPVIVEWEIVLSFPLMVSTRRPPPRSAVPPERVLRSRRSLPPTMQRLPPPVELTERATAAGERAVRDPQGLPVEAEEGDVAAAAVRRRVGLEPGGAVGDHAVEDREVLVLREDRAAGRLPAHRLAPGQRQAGQGDVDRSGELDVIHVEDPRLSVAAHRERGGAGAVHDQRAGDQDLARGEGDGAGEAGREGDLVGPGGRVGGEDRLPQGARTGVAEAGDREGGGHGAAGQAQGHDEEDERSAHAGILTPGLLPRRAA